MIYVSDIPKTGDTIRPKQAMRRVSDTYFGRKLLVLLYPIVEDAERANDEKRLGVFALPQMSRESNGLQSL